jgi:hypothetical protein
MGDTTNAVALSRSTQLWQLYKRTVLMYAREPTLTRVRLGQAVVVSLIVGLIYLQMSKAQVRCMYVS